MNQTLELTTRLEAEREAQSINQSRRYMIRRPMSHHTSRGHGKFRAPKDIGKKLDARVKKQKKKEVEEKAANQAALAERLFQEWLNSDD